MHVHFKNILYFNQNFNLVSRVFFLDVRKICGHHHARLYKQFNIVSGYIMKTSFEFVTIENIKNFFECKRSTLIEN